MLDAFALLDLEVHNTSRLLEAVSAPPGMCAIRGGMQRLPASVLFGPYASMRLPALAGQEVQAREAQEIDNLDADADCVHAGQGTLEMARSKARKESARANRTLRQLQDQLLEAAEAMAVAPASTEAGAGRGVRDADDVALSRLVRWCASASAALARHRREFKELQRAWVGLMRRQGLPPDTEPERAFQMEG